jgi:hypothetical protein
MEGTTHQTEMLGRPLIPEEDYCPKQSIVTGIVTPAPYHRPIHHHHETSNIKIDPAILKPLGKLTFLEESARKPYVSDE